MKILDKSILDLSINYPKIQRSKRGKSPPRDQREKKVEIDV